MNIVDSWIARRLTSEEIKKEIEEASLKAKEARDAFDKKFPPELWRKYCFRTKQSILASEYIDEKFFTDQEAIDHCKRKNWYSVRVGSVTGETIFKQPYKEEK